MYSNRGPACIDIRIMLRDCADASIHTDVVVIYVVLLNLYLIFTYLKRYFREGCIEKVTLFDKHGLEWYQLKILFNTP